MNSFRLLVLCVFLACTQCSNLAADALDQISANSFEIVEWNPQNSRVEFQGRPLFINGLNLAWDSFANDVGPDLATPDLEHFEKVLQQLQAAGGNNLRLWLHTNGTQTPEWSGLTVTGPGSGTIEDLKSILDLAAEYNISVLICLWSFDMLRISVGETNSTRNTEILTQDYARSSYMENALKPMVTALKGHPAILAWEIFNEAEGMSLEFGWDFNFKVSMRQIQRFINHAAGTIHRADPGAKVTNGSWSFIASTNVGEGNRNYYSDNELRAAGRDPDGTLDFYTVHYYDWAGTERSPFHHPASHWQLKKPLVIAEFYPDCEQCGTSPHLNLFENGYAGAVNWSWTDFNQDELLVNILDVSSEYPQDTILGLEGRPAIIMDSPADGSSMGFNQPSFLTASAVDADGGVTAVEFYEGETFLGSDNAHPWEWPVTPVILGETGFHAIVIDNEGNRARSVRNKVKVEHDPEPARLEAEDATSSGLLELALPGASGGAVMGLLNVGSLTWTVPDVPEAGQYYMTIGYNLVYESPKTNLFSVNDGTPVAVVFDGETEKYLQKVLAVELQAGTNTIRLTPDWGYMAFDYIAFSFLGEHVEP